MSGTKNSFSALSEQVIKNNKNSLEVMAKLNEMVTSNSSTVEVSLLDENGNPIVYHFPTVGFLKSEIDRLSSNLNTLASLTTKGAFVQDSANSFKKVIISDLNREPNTLSALNNVAEFKSDKNWFFDALSNPILAIEINLNGKVEDNVRRCMVRRYITRFNQDENGILTTLGQTGLTSFNNTFKGRSDIGLQEFETWHSNTPGVQNPTNPLIDEQIFELEPNELQYDGEFTVFSMEEDTVNKKLWYILDRLTFVDKISGSLRTLTVNDQLIVNTEISTSRYRVLEVSTATSQFRVRFERIEGFDPIPVGINTLKIYSPIVLNKNVKVSIGFNEHNVVFVRPMNTDNYLLAKSYSLGTAYYTNDLRLASADSNNGMSMVDYYTKFVYDYGLILQDLVAKKKPNSLGSIPNLVVIKHENFKVVQINKHLTDTVDAEEIRTKHNLKNTIKSEIDAISNALADKQRTLQTSRFASEADRTKAEVQLKKLHDDRESKSKTMTSVVTEILSLSKNKDMNDPKFKLRGFWDIPDAIQAFNSQPQEVIQFRIQYKYQSRSGSETPLESFKLAPTGLNGININTENNSNNLNRTKNAYFSNWNEFKTDVRKRKYDKTTNVWTWQIEDVENADTPNINQLDISLSPGEKVEIRIKSISEVGYPESPIESDWSISQTFEFPNDLKKVTGEDSFILKEATQEEQRVKFEQDLNAKGLGKHLNDSFSTEDIYIAHPTKTISTKYTDPATKKIINLEDYLEQLNKRLLAVEEQLIRSKGELKIRVFRGNVEYIINNGAELEFNIECEDYAELVDPANPRVYKDSSVYVINDYKVRIENIAQASPLGLLSSRKYKTIAGPENQFFKQSDIGTNDAPQIMWVNNNNEMLLQSDSGKIRGQLDNQWLWVSNYHNAITGSNKFTCADNGFGGFLNTSGSLIGNGFNTSIASIVCSDNKNVGLNDVETAIDAFANLFPDITNLDLWASTTSSGLGAADKRFAATVHPAINNFSDLISVNADSVKLISSTANNYIDIPLKIYFMLDAKTNTISNTNAIYNAAGAINRVKRTRYVKMFMEPENSTRPFEFTVKFNIYNKRQNLVTLANSIRNISNS